MNESALYSLQLFYSSAKTRKVREALKHFGEPKLAWQALLQMDRTLTSSLRDKQRLIERGMLWLEQHQCHAIAWHDPRYPESLRNVPSPPAFLFVRGNLDLLWHPQIALVGTRKPSASGYACAHQFAHHLAGAGYVITSGLATGIDHAAHQGAMQSGQTIAALATGPDMVFPSQHQELFEAICDNGAVITEHAPGVPALRSHFPARNRLIAGLSLGTVVIEAAIPSGALITARLAAELGKEVMAVPGSIHNPMVFGCHQLIREGAHLVEQAEEVAHIVSRGGLLQQTHSSKTVQSTRFATPVASEPFDLSPTQQQMWQAIGHDSVGIDTLCARTGLTAADISSMLVGMELSGWLENRGGRYHRVQTSTALARG